MAFRFLTVFEMTEKKRHKPFTIEEKLEIFNYKTEKPQVPFSEIGTVLNWVIKMTNAVDAR